MKMNDAVDPEPIEPEALVEACCDSGCDNCVLTVHAEAMAQWRLEHAAWQARQLAVEAVNER